MKIWNGYGSEHSMNLVLIGRFEKSRDAEHVESLMNKLRDRASEDEAYAISHASPQHQRFSDEMLALLRAHQVYSLRPAELEQFALDHRLDRDEACITIRTDEADVSAFLKIMVEAGARVEVFTARPEQQTSTKD